ncbi:MAG: metallophosphoesterase family protein [Clostridia bacterium]
MKKKLFVIALCMILLLSLVALTACKDDAPDDAPYTYEPSSDYYNLVAVLTDNGATTRSFSFFTANDESYRDACVVQLDPAGASETEPQFNTSDNFTINAVSEMADKYNAIQDGKTSAEQLKANANRNMINLTLNNIFPDRMGHHASATNLTSGQKYFYRMGCPDKDTWSSWGTFTTDDGDDTFSFLHITDSQADTKERFDMFAHSLRSAINHTGTPEFVLFTGDLVEDGNVKEEWDLLFESIKDFSNTLSFSAATGNHEKNSYNIAYNFNLPVPSDNFYAYYAYEYGDALVVVLDTEDDFLIAEQAAWADAVLAASNKKWKIVAFHKSLYSSGGHADADDTLRLKKIYTPILARNNVDLVMSGHDHVYARTVPVDGEGNPATFEGYREETLENGVVKEIYTKPNGVMYSINRTIGSKFYGGEGQNANVISVGDEGRADKPVFSKIDIVGSTLIYTAYEVDYDTGDVTIIDAFEINK